MRRYINIILSYSRALFSVVHDKLDATAKEVEFLLIFFRSQHDIFTWLSNPVVPLMYKREIILCMRRCLSEDLTRFIMIMLVNKRFCLLLPILEQFLSFVKTSKGEIEVILTSSEPLSSSDIKMITESFSFLGKITKVDNTVDPTILGGFIIRYGFSLIDASFKSYLGRLVNLSKHEILKREFL